jgi:hypothetical protein
MATALTATSRHIEFSPPPPFKEKSVEFQGFIKTVTNLLNNNSFLDLEFFFHTSIDIFRPTLDVSNELDHLLETYLSRSSNSPDCIRALRLASVMENHNINVKWTKIAQAICYFQQGNHADVESLVKDMVISDAHPLGKGIYLSILEGHDKIYGDMKNVVMRNLVQRMIFEYKQMSSSFANPARIPAGALRV